MKFRNIFTEKKDIENIIKATDISSEILEILRNAVVIGANAGEIDILAQNLCNEHKVSPAFKGVEGTKTPFPSGVCVSVNEEAIHAIPYKEKVFKSGDIVKIDFGIIYNGFYTDHCVTVGLGSLTPREQALINTAKLCIDTAIKEAIVGNYVGDISFALQSVAQLGGFNYVKNYCGHGIGKSLHESPEILSYGEKKTGLKLQKGMLICIENQITLGSSELELDNDGWTLKTIDSSKSAMFEHMVLVDKIPRVLTKIS